MCGLVFLVNFARVVYAPLLEPLRRAFAADAAAVGLVVTAVWLGSALLRAPTGYLLTRYRRHEVLAATGTLLTVSAALTPLATGLPTLLVGAFAMGLASGSFFVAANPLLSELFPERVGRMVGWLGLAGQTAAVAAPALVTAALAVGNWQTVFRWTAGAAAVTTVVFVAVAHRSELPEAGATDRDLAGAVRAQWRIVASAVLIVGLTAFVWQGVFNFFVSYALATGLTEATGRALLSVLFGAGVPAFALTGRLADRLPRVPLLLGVVGAFTLCLFALTAVEGALALGVVAAATGYTVHSLFPVADTYLLASLPDRHRASAYAIYSAGMMLVQAPGSWAVGALTSHGLSFVMVFRGLAICLGMVLAALVLAHRADRLPATARA
jgi:DHA1 family inner membrane transport protein